MRWIARQRLSRVLLAAIAWPLGLGLFIAVRMALVLLPQSGEGRFFAIHVAWPALLALLLVPPALIIATWLVARSRVPPAAT